ncbi:chemotaxis protein CheC [Rhodoferax ferrireducens]|jgi:chemotaxis protein CheC|uniref:chemotaxis protein CheC n=1 Tax=Rhodoferax ferrireducens TaxID=192843 RepID=UPI003BB67BD7
MTITAAQLDALTEIFNIGAGRAASSLSDIVGDEVLLSVPRVEFYRAHEVNAKVLSLSSARLGSVKQKFRGPFNLTASLLFTEERALEIVQEMLGSQVQKEDLVEYEQEAMCEVGNIILNACLSAMADMLGISFESTLPEYSSAEPDVVIERLVADADNPLMLVLHINMLIEKRRSQGTLIFWLSSSSLQELMLHLEQFVSRI